MSKDCSELARQQQAAENEANIILDRLNELQRTIDSTSSADEKAKLKKQLASATEKWNNAEKKLKLARLSLNNCLKNN